MIKTIIGTNDFIEYLRGKSATFLLALSTTKTCQIEGITQAGIPGLIHLTPTLDAEFLCTGSVRSLQNVAKTPKGVPTPALITRAVHLLNPYSKIEILDLGMEVKPKLDYFKLYDFGINPSNSIDEGANIDAQKLFEKGFEFGKNYKCDDGYVILAESVPAGTTTAETTSKALGYECDGKFASSFKDTPNSIKRKIIKKALQNIKDKNNLFEKISQVSDNMLIFNAGFILGANKNETNILLAGGTQMAAVLLLVNSLINHTSSTFDSKNLALCTTKWVAEDENSNIKSLLEMVDFPINAYYADFDFSLSSNEALKLYDKGEAKEGVGAGGALVYGFLNGLDKQNLTAKIEAFLQQ